MSGISHSAQAASCVQASSCRRQTVTTALRSNLSRQTSSTIQQAMKRAFSAEKSLASTRLSPDIREALKAGQKMDLPTTAHTGIPAPESAAKASSAAARNLAGVQHGAANGVSCPLQRCAPGVEGDCPCSQIAGQWSSFQVPKTLLTQNLSHYGQVLKVSFLQLCCWVKHADSLLHDAQLPCPGQGCCLLPSVTFPFYPNFCQAQCHCLKHQNHTLLWIQLYSIADDGSSPRAFR